MGELVTIHTGSFTGYYGNIVAQTSKRKFTVELVGALDSSTWDEDLQPEDRLREYDGSALKSVNSIRSLLIKAFVCVVLLSNTLL